MLPLFFAKKKLEHLAPEIGRKKQWRFTCNRQNNKSFVWGEREGHKHHLLKRRFDKHPMLMAGFSASSNAEEAPCASVPVSWRSSLPARGPSTGSTLQPARAEKTYVFLVNGGSWGMEWDCVAICCYVMFVYYCFLLLTYFWKFMNIYIYTYT